MKRKEKVFEIIFLLVACISIVAVAMICIFLFANGIPAMGKIGLGKFLGGQVWKPGNDKYGIFPMIIGSLYHGFQSGTTDNAAHIGGCIAGFILSMLLYVLGSLIAAHKQGRSV